MSDEHELCFRRAQAGDEEAYEQLFLAAGEDLLYFAEIRLGRKLRTTIDPLDIVQETYLQALRSLADHDYRGEESFTRWLWAIAENRIRDQARYESAGQRQPSGKRLRHSRVLEQLRSSRTGPATRAVHLEQREHLAVALQELPAEIREVVLLRKFHEWTFEQIATALELSPTTARRRYAEAILELGKRLDDDPVG